MPPCLYRERLDIRMGTLDIAGSAEQTGGVTAHERVFEARERNGGTAFGESQGGVGYFLPSKARTVSPMRIQRIFAKRDDFDFAGAFAGLRLTPGIIGSA